MYKISTLFGEELVELTKQCIKCGEIKSIFEFSARTSDRADMVGVERRNECKDCKKKLQQETARLKKQYTKPKDLMVCPICDRHEDEFKKRWCLDHDHETGTARGFICDDCNGMLGKALDNPQTLYKGYEYLCNGGTITELYPTLESENDDNKTETRTSYLSS